MRPTTNTTSQFRKILRIEGTARRKPGELALEGGFVVGDEVGIVFFVLLDEPVFVRWRRDRRLFDRGSCEGDLFCSGCSRWSLRASWTQICVFGCKSLLGLLCMRSPWRGAARLAA